MDKQEQEPHVEGLLERGRTGSTPNEMPRVSAVEYVIYSRDADARGVLDRAFRSLGVAVACANSLDTAVARLRQRGHHVMLWRSEERRAQLANDIADVREHGVRAPILVVLNCVSGAERISLRVAGADNVVEASRGTDEIMSCAMALGRLVCRYLIREFCGGSLIMDFETGWVHCADSGEIRSDHFARQEFDFLFVCAEHAGQLVTHTRIDKYVFGRDMNVDRGRRTTVKNNVDGKLRKISLSRTIRSMRSEGYMLCGAGEGTLSDGPLIHADR